MLVFLTRGPAPLPTVTGHLGVRMAHASQDDSPFDDNRARALRRLDDTIAALDLARRSESGLSGEEVDAQHDNLVRAVRLLRSGAR